MLSEATTCNIHAYYCKLIVDDKNENLCSMMILSRCFYCQEFMCIIIARFEKHLKYEVRQYSKLTGCGMSNRSLIIARERMTSLAISSGQLSSTDVPGHCFWQLKIAGRYDYTAVSRWLYVSDPVDISAQFYSYSTLEMIDFCTNAPRNDVTNGNVHCRPRHAFTRTLLPRRMSTHLG